MEGKRGSIYSVPALTEPLPPGLSPLPTTSLHADFLLILSTQVTQLVLWEELSTLLWSPREPHPCPTIELLTAEGKLQGSSPSVGAMPPPLGPSSWSPGPGR